MAITSTTVGRTGTNQFRIIAASDNPSPTFYWYWNGALVASGNLPFRDYTISPGESGRWAVFDSDTDVPPVAFPSRVRVEWENAGDADHYTVSHFDGVTTVTSPKIPAGNHGSMSWTTPVLAETPYQIKVAAVGENGNTGILRSFIVEMVRTPDPPTQNITYDADTGELAAS